LSSPLVDSAGVCGRGCSVFVGARGGGGSRGWLFVVPAAFDLALVLFRFHIGEEKRAGCFGSRV
jgi:hypothetical protein